MLYRRSIHSCISWACSIIHWRVWDITINCQSYYFTTSNLRLHLVCYCMQLMWPTPPLPRPISSILDQRLWGTKSKHNSTNRDSYTFHSFHIPSKYLQWFWRTSCYLDINNNTPYFVFEVLKVHSFLKIYFIKILLPKHSFTRPHLQCIEQLHYHLPQEEGNTTNFLTTN